MLFAFAHTANNFYPFRNISCSQGYKNTELKLSEFENLKMQGSLTTNNISPVTQSIAKYQDSELCHISLLQRSVPELIHNQEFSAHRESFWDFLLRSLLQKIVLE